MERIEELLEEIREQLRLSGERGTSQLPLVLTMEAAAEQLSVSKRTLVGLVSSGQLAVCAVGKRKMVPRQELERIAKSAERRRPGGRRSGGRQRSRGYSASAEAEKLSEALTQR